MVVATVAGALTLSYAGAAVAFAGEVPRGARVAGVDVGGLDRDGAVAKVRSAAQGQGAPLILRAGDRTATLDRVEAGLTVDAEGAVDDLVGPAFAPATVWRHVRGGGASGVAGVDAGKLTAAVTAAAKASLDVEAKDGGVRFAATGASAVDPVTGRTVDVPGAVAAVQAAWLTASGPIEVPVRSVEPTVAAAQVEQAMAGFGATALAGPLPVVVGDRTVSLPSSAVAPALSAKAGTDGTLSLAVDGKVLAAALLKADPEIGSRPKDARIVLAGDRPKIIPAVSGVTVDPAPFAAAAATALAAQGAARSVKAPVTSKQPDLTTAEATELGVKEVTSTFATNLTANAGRTENLRIAARTVNGTLVLPGETFSLNGVLGERTAAKGYNQAPAISGGRLVKDFGGGVSQMATTIFNNVFFTGLEDIYHKPHSFYISRYPEGREATVNWPTVDLKWRNDSPYAVLIQAWVDTRVHVTFWSTTTWEIDATKSGRSNFRTPKTIYDPSDGCVSQDANGGFDVSVGRIFRKNGQVVRRETFRTSYIAEDKVVCGPKPGATPKPTPSSGSTG
jgi:vancomycin resistance protein YoaR